MSKLSKEIQNKIIDLCNLNNSRALEKFKA